MKREKFFTVTILILLAVCASLMLAALTSNAGGALNKYDLNGDGEVTVVDVTALLNYMEKGCEHQPVTVARVEPTCARKGCEAYRVCALCGQVLDEIVPIDKLPHTVVIDEATPPSCTGMGMTEGSHCSVCGEVLVEREIVPATGHILVIDEALAPTCTESGLSSGSHCSVCGEVTARQTVLPATGHFFENGVCTRCGAVLTALQKGDEYIFGAYEQDGDAENGAEEIVWTVLDVVDGRALLLAKNILDRQQYHGTFSAVTWEKSDLRAWLNDSFYTAAFSAAEKARIAETVNENPGNPFNGRGGGNDTADRVFLLCYDDVVNASYGFSEDFEAHDGARIGTSSAYAAGEVDWWWLRTPGTKTGMAMVIDDTGAATLSYDVSASFGVRPALWIILDEQPGETG